MAYGYNTKEDFRRTARVVRRVEGSGYGGTTPTERRPITQGTGVPVYDGPFKVSRVSPSSADSSGANIFSVDAGMALFGTYAGYYDGLSEVTVEYPPGANQVTFISVKMTLSSDSSADRGILFEIIEGTEAQTETTIVFPIAMIITDDGEFTKLIQTHHGNMGAFGRWV